MSRTSSVSKSESSSHASSQGVAPRRTRPNVGESVEQRLAALKPPRPLLAVWGTQGAPDAVNVVNPAMDSGGRDAAGSSPEGHRGAFWEAWDIQAI